MQCPTAWWPSSSSDWLSGNDCKNASRYHEGAQALGAHLSLHPARAQSTSPVCRARGRTRSGAGDFGALKRGAVCAGWMSFRIWCDAAVAHSARHHPRLRMNPIGKRQQTGKRASAVRAKSRRYGTMSAIAAVAQRAIARRRRRRGRGEGDTWRSNAPIFCATRLAARTAGSLCVGDRFCSA